MTIRNNGRRRRGGLFRVEKVKVKAATMGHHHQMSDASDMRHSFIVIFHFLFPLYVETEDIVTRAIM